LPPERGPEPDWRVAGVRVAPSLVEELELAFGAELGRESEPALGDPDLGSELAFGAELGLESEPGL
jgi:hypothetical protein